MDSFSDRVSVSKETFTLTTLPCYRNEHELPDDPTERMSRLEYLLSLDIDAIMAPFLESCVDLPQKPPVLPCLRMQVPEDEEPWRRELPVDPEARDAKLDELLSIDIDAEMAPFFAF